MSNTQQLYLRIGEEEYETIHKMEPWINWEELSMMPLTEHFIREFADYVDWEMISLYQRHLSDGFIRELSDYIDWEMICRTGCLSETIIREFSDDIHWDLISHAAPSEDLIREFADKVNWQSISSCQDLSVPFIKEFSDRVDWDCISRHQVLSNELCDAFCNKLNWDEIALDRESLHYSFVKKYNDRIPKIKKVLNLIEKANEVKEAIMNTTFLPDLAAELIAEFLL